ncbi:MAG: uroporphyrinogen-III C-methyltransferase [Gammaproteobacteria bacterium]|nr:uroporphyrinogen-III C-methyltransferase [Gammaproteobacteria bacterium]
MQRGFVSLVGAGPGDPELLTIKALRLLQEADVVVYDRLVSDEVLKLIPVGVGKISVGKNVGNHCVPQDQINEMIINLASSGRHVVRLKGGDPYLFGRGGEEAIALSQHNIPFDVVPGITAATGCSAYSGIPLTHRGLNHGVHFITGHFHDDMDLNLNWEKLADPDCTLVIYMGLGSLPGTLSNLVNAGLSASTPAAAIHAGTTSKQRKIISTLAGLNEAVLQAQLASPVLIIVGDVVSLSNRIDWFSQQQHDYASGPKCETIDSIHA